MTSPPVPVPVVRRKKSRQTVLLAALVPVFVLVWLPLLRSRDGAAPVAARLGPEPAVAEPNASAAATPLAESAAPLAQPGSAGAIAELGRRIQALAAPYEPRWRGHDAGPAAAPSARAGAATPSNDVPPAELVPTAILLTPGKDPVAIVKGMPIRVGDTVDGLTLVAIHEHDVQWRAGERTYVVPLPTPALGGSR